MAESILVIGDTGSGKSTSLGKNDKLEIEGLNPKETFIINTKGKPLPLRGWKQHYIPIDMKAGPAKGNYLATTDSKIIVDTINFINSNREDIKVVVIDDFQFILSEQFMAKALQPGYDKFNLIGKQAYDVMNAGINMKDDKTFIMLSHEDEENGKLKMKLIGRMLEDKATPPSLFTVVLYASTKTTNKGDTTYHFITNRTMDSRGLLVPAKSPPEMFDDLYINNDLGKIVKTMRNYYN